MRHQFTGRHHQVSPLEPPRALGRAAEGLTIVTPSYRPDVELFEDLHASVLQFADASARHVVVVPERDRQLFSQRFAGPRCEVVSVGDVLPRRIRSLPGLNGWVNLRHPAPPLRGWIVQQLVKLSIPEVIDTDVAVLADSDICFIRPFSSSTFVDANGVVRFYRVPQCIDPELPHRQGWDDAARDLVAAPGRTHLALTDYISALMAWDARVVREMRDRIEHVTHREWLDSVGRLLHFSEFTLYGTYLDAATSGLHPASTDDSLCLSYWDTSPLDDSAADTFLGSLSDSDIAVLISAKSGTDLSVRRRAFARVMA